MNIGDSIKSIRQEKGLTQKELSLKAHISRSYLADLENNRYNPSVDTLNSISKALQTPLTYFLDNSKSSKICLRAVQYFGKASRKQLTQEECAELIQALSKDLRGKTHNVEEEIADVLIMIEQLKCIYDNDKIEKYREEKINRLNELMENREGKNE